MDWGQIKSGIMDRFLTAVAMLAVGWFLGTTETTQIKNDVRDLAKQQKDWEEQAKPRRAFLGDVANRTEYMCARDAECRARFQPLQVPE